MRLLRTIGLDDLVGDVATAATKVAPRPDMTAPKALPQVEKLTEQAIGAFALHPLDQATDGDVRWDGDPHMDLSRGDMPLQDIDARLLTCFVDNGPHPFRHLTTPHFVAILRDPDDMQVERAGRMGARAIGTQAPEASEKLLKLPPQGGGFAPPNWRQ